MFTETAEDFRVDFRNFKLKNEEIGGKLEWLYVKNS